MRDGTCFGYEGRHRFSRLGFKRLPGSAVFLSDGTKREITGYAEIRREPPFWAHLYGGGTLSGEPVLSATKGQFDLDELKQEVLKRKWYGIGETKKAFKQQLDEVKTFDDLHRLCMRL
ncbi:MAG: hypothetical protein ABL949_12405 [Fimbriimonadaceae bacterium]